MTAETKTSVKARFQTGDRPTQADFAALVESYLDAVTTVLPPITTTASAGNYAASAPQIAALVDGVVVALRINASCASSATLSLNGLTAAPIFKQVRGGIEPVAANDLGPGNLLIAAYSSGAFVGTVAQLPVTGIGDAGSIVQVDPTGRHYELASTGAFLRSDQTATVSVGYTNTSHSYGSVSTGTVTVNFALSAQAHYTNAGAHTLAPPSSGEGGQDILVTNGPAAGLITVTGWQDVVGDALTTVNGARFLISARRINARNILLVTALQ